MARRVAAAAARGCATPEARRTKGRVSFCASAAARAPARWRARISPPPPPPRRVACSSPSRMHAQGWVPRLERPRQQLAWAASSGCRIWRGAPWRARRSARSSPPRSPRASRGRSTAGSPARRAPPISARAGRRRAVRRWRRRWRGACAGWCRSRASRGSPRASSPSRSTPPSPPPPRSAPRPPRRAYSSAGRRRSR